MGPLIMLLAIVPSMAVVDVTSVGIFDTTSGLEVARLDVVPGSTVTEILEVPVMDLLAIREQLTAIADVNGAVDRVFFQLDTGGSLSASCSAGCVQLTNPVQLQPGIGADYCWFEGFGPYVLFGDSGGILTEPNPGCALPMDTVITLYMETTDSADGSLGQYVVGFILVDGIETAAPSESPTPSPTPLPSKLPTPVPTQPRPTALPTPIPSPMPSPLPSPMPTSLPSSMPSPEPTVSSMPTVTPTFAPTPGPSFPPTPLPSMTPTSAPTPRPMRGWRRIWT